LTHDAKRISPLAGFNLETRRKVMANKECPVTCGNDVVTNTLRKVGVGRSMMITLALLPFSWNGVVWVADAVQSLWNAATSAVGT